MARLRPQRSLRLEYRVASSTIARDIDSSVAAVLDDAGFEWERDEAGGWQFLVPITTRVYGFIPREIDEECQLGVSLDSEPSKLTLVCHPTEFHSAHSAGLAGVLAVAVVAWIAGDLSGGFLPAVTILIAGGLLVEVTRHWALEALERRLHDLLDVVGRSLWPKGSAQIVVSIDRVS